MPITSKDAKEIVNQIEDIQALITHASHLGMKAICLDQRIVGLHPRTIKVIEDGGFLVTRRRQIIDPEKDLEEDMIFIDWH